MKRHELLNWLIEEHGYQRYLEIGVDNPNNCFNYIKAAHKVGVDPNKNTTYRLTSDQFFAANTEEFDIVFVDGLHTADQAYRDVINALAVLAPMGTIVMHDCRPYNATVAAPERDPGCSSWYGTVWQAWARLRSERPDLRMHVYGQDCGCGIIQRGSQVVFAGKYETYDDYLNNYDEILQLVDDNQVAQIFGRTR